MSLDPLALYELHLVGCRTCEDVLHSADRCDTDAMCITGRVLFAHWLQEENRVARA